MCVTVIFSYRVFVRRRRCLFLASHPYRLYKDVVESISTEPALLDSGFWCLCFSFSEYSSL